MKHKRGFTLAEMLIILTIVGILMTTAITIMKPYDKMIRPMYSNLYHTLNTAIYNASIQQHNWPFGSDPDTRTAATMCKALVEYIDIVEDRDTVCDAFTPVTQNAEDSEFAASRPENVAFTCLNGISIYITEIIDNGVDNDPFYIIYADISGLDKGRNSVAYEENVLDPDIFAFAAISSGRMVPLGPPEVDGRYMLTRSLFKFAPCNEQPNFLFDAEGNIRRDEDGNPLVAARRWNDTTNSVENWEKPIHKRTDAEGNDLRDNKGRQLYQEYEYDPELPACGEEIGTNLDEMQFSVVSEPYYITQAKTFGLNLGENDAQEGRTSNPYTYNAYIRSVIPNSHIYDNVPLPVEKLLRVAPDVTVNTTRLCGYRSSNCSMFVDKYIH